MFAQMLIITITVSPLIILYLENPPNIAKTSPFTPPPRPHLRIPNPGWGTRRTKKLPILTHIFHPLATGPFFEGMDPLDRGPVSSFFQTHRSLSFQRLEDSKESPAQFHNL